MSPIPAAPIRTTNGFAVAALIFGILGWTMLPLLGSIGAIIFGHLARGQIRRAHGGQDGDGLALAGLILGWIAVSLAVAGIVIVFLFLGGLAWLASMSV